VIRDLQFVASDLLISKEAEKFACNAYWLTEVFMQQEQLFGTERSLSGPSQPHFDEEATLLSARPVIPLAVVGAKSRRKSWLLFGGSIVLALLAGATAAILLQSSVNQPEEQAYAQVVPDTKSVDGDVTSKEPIGLADLSEITGGAGAYEETFQISDPQLGDLTSSRTPKPERHKNAVEVQPIKPVAKSTPKVTPRTHDEQIEQTVPYGREEQRPRRVSPSESETNADRSSDDLFRIREIFEGPRRRRLRDRSRRDW
jgi:hypothetical protein